MKNPKSYETRNRTPVGHQGNGGFALVVVLTLMVLLLIIALGMLSLGTVSLRSSVQADAMGVAKANARMGLMLALGELQKQAGVDQAITASSSILGADVRHPHWTGVWKNGEAPVWLASHAGAAGSPDPESEIAGEKAVLFGQTTTDPGVEVAFVKSQSAGGFPNRFAWWVGDEGVKTRVDIQKPQDDADFPAERVSRSASAQMPGLVDSSALWDDLDPGQDRSLFITLPTSAIAAGAPDLVKDFLHDYTTGGYGLPVNVRDGGMKVDLSTVFDETDPDHGKNMEVYFGSRPQLGNYGGAEVALFTEPADEDAEKRFFLVESLTKGGTKPVGPNWGIIYNQARSYRNVKDGAVTVSGAFPALGISTDLRSNNWAPYTATKFGGAGDAQHVSSGARPVISTLQLGFRLSAREVPPPEGADPLKKHFQIQIQAKPLFGLWNPYNVALEASQNGYVLEWAVYPYFRLGIENGSSDHKPQVWMRDLWQTTSGNTGLHGRWFRLTVIPTDFEPGEFRYFSIDKKATLGGGNRVSPKWSRDGAFEQDLFYNDSDGTPPGKEGLPMIVEEGTLVSMEDIFVEDTQHPATADYYGNIPTSSTPSWASLKTGSYQTLNRWSGTWVSGESSAGWSVPEKLVNSGAVPKFSVEQLAVTHEHIGTWSLKARTTTEPTRVSDSGGGTTQTLRGTVDTNVRALVANPLWDGSRAPSGDFDGWWYLSNMIGGGHPGVHSDGGPNGRGMVAMGSAIGDEAPQVKLPDTGRFQGFGGAASGPSGGQTHVAVIDVPRGPPVSIGALQYADLGRYNFEPTRVVGNSYANVRIPLGETVSENFADFAGFTLADISYDVNGRLWDGYFFSTLAPEYSDQSATSLNAAFPIEEIAFGKTPLPNPRIVFLPRSADVSLEEIKEKSGGNPAEAIASRIGISGAFNVNSTSKAAWKAQLASMSGSEFAVVSADGIGWQEKDGIRMTGSRVVIDPSGFHKGDSGAETKFWQGQREIDAAELDELAGQIVNEVRERGPFLSMADFVNRDPESSDADHQRKGALQAALDRTLNAGLGGDVGEESEQLSGALGVNGVIDPSDPESQAVGHGGYAMQGDLLDALGPVMQVRSDYFRIRAVGETLSADGKSVIARAVCEAFVQRTADYVDGSETPETHPDDLTVLVNEEMGRRFVIVSFRWLSPGEI